MCTTLGRLLKREDTTSGRFADSLRHPIDTGSPTERLSLPLQMKLSRSLEVASFSPTWARYWALLLVNAVPHDSSVLWLTLNLGRLVETSPEYEIIHQWPEDLDGTLNILGQQFSPHGLSIDFDRSLILTSYLLPI